MLARAARLGSIRVVGDRWPIRFVRLPRHRPDDVPEVGEKERDSNRYHAGHNHEEQRVLLPHLENQRPQRSGCFAACASAQ